jgi:hypothetical protein
MAAQKHSSLGIQLDVGDVKNVSGLTDIPDMGATPEKLDVTTLADASRQYIEGIKDYGDLEFTFIYESGAEGNYAQLNGLEGQQDCVVTFPDGSKFSFKGEVSLRIVGVGVNAVITFVMAVALSSDIVYAPAAN